MEFELGERWNCVNGMGLSCGMKRMRECWLLFVMVLSAGVLGIVKKASSWSYYTT